MTIRNRHIFLADLLVIAAVPVLSFTVRLDTLAFQRFYRPCLAFIVAALLVKPLVLHSFGLYRRLWRYASIAEAVAVGLAVSISSVILAAVVFGLLLPFGVIRRFPRSVIVIDWLLSLLLIGGIRFSVRLLPRQRTARGGRGPLATTGPGTRVLIIGAGDAGAMLLREIQANRDLEFTPIGFIDDDPVKLGMRIHNVPVLGPRDQIASVVEREAVDQVIIAMPTVSGKVIREIIALCEEADVPFRTLPGMYELLDGTASVSQVRQIGVEDLLRREQAFGDLETPRDFLAGGRVLVTGAGGSIGSELCRQIAIHRPQQLILLGHGENSIYRIQLELSTRFPAVGAVPIIADVRDRARLNAIMSQHRPNMVFHAAAHKHVPLMERNPVEAITNNVVGTHTVAQLAVLHGAERFVLISTDKAVNPVNIMGASKRVAELLVQDMGGRYDTVLASVRFGNVLGSRGSVVPLFQRQIAAGGPVTVTHPEVERFFMTIPEAVQLVIEAAAMGRGGEIFVLDMGEQVKVLDLARDVIRLSGLEVGRDIDIAFTELRPGEKMREELFSDVEQPRPTPHHKILVIDPDPDLAGRNLADDIAELEELAQDMDTDGIMARLQDIVPEFRPSVGQRNKHGTGSTASPRPRPGSP